ncbi:MULTISPECIES: Hsp33 family molecular chaperone HslO [Clostridia]|jgi:molecular chaperone Hsp33|uniref:33 kDa chaperonin n=1 Tax=Butyribacter intestini TaxID=1703332 RepID=A0AAW3JU20_9FIRM|nr:MULTISPECIES: Hsp33 family molecular chaperone HslO [Clostridia]OKZ78903.1 MAG: Hsp33 family molecular chaperone [Clostridium sp. CAG:12237_41]UYJ41380.1 MAG: Hsp33 family molecular chaperone HslO [Lachnospiraceae bacterium]KQC85199.1 heat-shock protein Hsp33 [Butyribacter intestini]RHP26103.1 Hsp33 family molecular chaperone HslO [Clostridium sp. AF34-13]RHU74479.1 Hsp33 family molecular chaperone HslO [Butyribacter intestini]
MSEYKDYIVRATAADHQLRAFAVTSKDIVEKAREIHNTSPVATAAIGRLLTAASMMGSMMKGEKDVLTLQIECGGPIGGITVTADSNADVKGYVNNPNVILPPNAQGKLDVSGALGPGFLNVIKDIGLREPYNGQTHLVSGEIAEDLTYYFATSEQVPSSVGLGVLMDKDNHVRQAGGFIIQVMPDTDDEVIDKLEARLGEVHSVTEMLDKGMTPEDILNYVLEGMDVEILETVPTQYKCDCSFERVSKVIASLGKKELQEMIDDGKPVEVNCQFCGSHYKFDTEQLKEFIK